MKTSLFLCWTGNAIYLAGVMMVLRRLSIAAIWSAVGTLLAAAQEERFTRRKHDANFQTQAVESCLRAGGIKSATSIKSRSTKNRSSSSTAYCIAIFPTRRAS